MSSYLISALASGVSSSLSAGIDNIGNALTSSSSNMQALSVSAINRGAAAAQAKQYDLALQEFTRASAYDPTNTDVYSYKGQVYMMLGETQKAIAAYQRGLTIDPTYDDMRNSLANAYIANNDYANAETQLKQLARTNPTNAGPPTTLGQIYMQQGRYAEADTQFKRAIEISPTSSTAYSNLGQLRNDQQDYTDAIKQFQQALSLDPKNDTAIANLARSYLGIGDASSAKTLYNQLVDMGTTSSLSLASGVEHDIMTPKILYEDPAQSNFSSLLPAGTNVSALDSSLATPGASKVFKITFVFNNPMDLASITNALNWTISKGTGGTAGVYGSGGTYNDPNDVNVPIAPLSVTYDPNTYTATVYFRVTQNSTGTGTIDPSHLVFKFSGKDSYGRSMDTSGDQYDGHNIMPF